MSFVKLSLLLSGLKRKLRSLQRVFGNRRVAIIILTSFLLMTIFLSLKLNSKLHFSLDSTKHNSRRKQVGFFSLPNCCLGNYINRVNFSFWKNSPVSKKYIFDKEHLIGTKMTKVLSLHCHIFLVKLTFLVSTLENQMNTCCFFSRICKFNNVLDKFNKTKRFYTT